MTKPLPLAVPFKMNNDEYNDDVKEFNILFFKSRNRLEDLIEFVQEYEDTRVNIRFPEGVHIPTLKSITKVSDKIHVRLTAADIPIVQELRNQDIKFFFDETMPVYNYSNLAAFIELGVSDIYPADDLCHNLSEVSVFCRERDVHMRLVLNRIPATTFNKGVDPKSPIFRPQNIDVLQDFFDVFELDCGEPYDWAKCDVLRRAWFGRKHWHGELSEINEDLNMRWNNDAVMPNFDYFKMTCGRRCDQRNSNHCRKCEQVLEISDEFMKMGIGFKTKK